MNSFLPGILAFLLLGGPFTQPTFSQEIELQPGSAVYFASVDQAKEILGRSDLYTRTMTPLDRSLQMRSNQTFSEEEFLDYAAQQARAWTSAEILKLTNVISQFRARLANFALPFPARIALIKTTGLEMFGSTYVRSGNIVFVPGILSLPVDRLVHIFIHELFHVLSSQNVALRPALYSVLGYLNVGDIEIPASLRPLLMTNPDYFEKNYGFQVTTEQQTYTAIPILHSNVPEYDGSNDLFHYAHFLFMLLENKGGRWEPILQPDGQPTALPEDATGLFYLNMGLPEYRVFQPEETLADLFPHVVLGQTAVPSPRVTHRLREALTRLGVAPPGPPAGILDAVLTVPQQNSAYLVEVTTNFQNWVAIDKRTASENRLSFNDRSAFLNDLRFYRARLAPDTSPEPGDTNQMVWIPPGTFTMGSKPTEPGYQPSDGPLTQVTLTRGFWIGRFEVTIGEYLGVIAEPMFDHRDKTEPAFPVSWTQANTYCKTLTENARASGQLSADLEYRLPTEAEWEYACRAGTTTTFYWGDDPVGIYTHERMTDSATGMPIPGTKLPNPWGLYDMLGNVAELCLDRWRDRLPGGQVTDPKGPATGAMRVLRGGEFFSFAHSARAGSRRPRPIEQGEGFRIVLAPVP